MGFNIIWKDTVNSTNDLVKEMVRSGQADGDFVLAAHDQIAGKGQYDRVWETSKGENLTFTVYIKEPGLLLSDQFYLSKAIAIGLIEFLHQHGIVSQIKWPNDILVDGKKISGILIENMLRGEQLEAALVGIGLNVNQTAFNSGFSAISMKAENGVQYDLNRTLLELMIILEGWIKRVKQHHFGRIDEEYHRHLAGLNEKREATVDGVKQRATLLKVLSNGNMVAEINGEIKAYTQTALSLSV